MSGPAKPPNHPVRVRFLRAHGAFHPGSSGELPVAEAAALEAQGVLQIRPRTLGAPVGGPPPGAPQN